MFEIIVHHADHDRCRDCPTDRARFGFMVEDKQGVLEFVCTEHLLRRLNDLLRPLRTATVEA